MVIWRRWNEWGHKIVILKWIFFFDKLNSKNDGFFFFFYIDLTIFLSRQIKKILYEYKYNHTLIFWLKCIRKNNLYDNDNWQQKIWIQYTK